VSCQYTDKTGLSLSEENFFPETINPKTGEPPSDGEMGQLVFTSSER